MKKIYAWSLILAFLVAPVLCLGRAEADFASYDLGMWIEIDGAAAGNGCSISQKQMSNGLDLILDISSQQENKTFAVTGWKIDFYSQDGRLYDDLFSFSYPQRDGGVYSSTVNLLSTDYLGGVKIKASAEIGNASSNEAIFAFNITDTALSKTEIEPTAVVSELATANVDKQVDLSSEDKLATVSLRAEGVTKYWSWYLLVAVFFALWLVIFLYVRSLNIHSVSNIKNGSGIAGVFVEFYDDAGKIIINTMTDSEGRFYARLAPGEYRVRIGKGGFIFKGIKNHPECKKISDEFSLEIKKPERLKLLVATKS